MLAWWPRIHAPHEIRRQAESRPKTKRPAQGALFWQNRSPYEFHAPGLHEQTASCTRQQAKTVSGLRLMAQPLNAAHIRPVPRKRRFGEWVEIVSIFNKQTPQEPLNASYDGQHLRQTA